MTNKILPLVLLSLCVPKFSEAFLGFGGEAVILSKILAESISQLEQLRAVVGTGKDTLQLIEEINRGVNEGLGIARTIHPDFNPGIYKNWSDARNAIRDLEAIYGKIPNSGDSKAQRHSDQATAEVISNTNRYYKHSDQHDKLGEDIKSASRSRSPGGAQKLIAESQGLLIQGLNENLRAQADGNKIAAIALSQSNKKEKDAVKDRNQMGSDVEDALASLKGKKHFSLPVF